MDTYLSEMEVLFNFNRRYQYHKRMVVRESERERGVKRNKKFKVNLATIKLTQKVAGTEKETATTKQIPTETQNFELYFNLLQQISVFFIFLLVVHESKSEVRDDGGVCEVGDIDVVVAMGGEATATATNNEGGATILQAAITGGADRVAVVLSSKSNKRLEVFLISVVFAIAAAAFDFFVLINENGVDDNRPRLSKCSLNVNVVCDETVEAADDEDEFVFVVLADTVEESLLTVEEVVDKAEQPEDDSEEVVEDDDEEDDVENFLLFFSFLLLLVVLLQPSIVAVLLVMIFFKRPATGDRRHTDNVNLTVLVKERKRIKKVLMKT
ncbi:hypothetical protein FF38_07673 [Lucilia cuprina]|uniref:Uncharacterized protein n=1 Tax=Lucilia cuprina TaxID=7375 RepID=A0A0L0BQT0_LUCCU|nr:hypothetical protein FF38_07673 [Lucilia cuprina]